MRQSEHAPARHGRWRGWIVLVVAVLLFVWVSLYRFNTLGGAFGGFDNDHFLHFAYAKQVQAGEQPLRDFQDGGLQGARPSLTYELSAAAQRLFGDNLRSEAWLTVGGVALGAAVTVIAGARIAPWPLALLMAWLSALISPKLYGYPKVLVLAVATLLVVCYAARPLRRYAIAMAVWTAVAFLFRHDYAVYCGVGFAIVLVLAHRRDLHQGFMRLVAYGALTLVLLGPSLWWVQQHRGIVEYLRNGLAMGRREAMRTELPWPRFELSDVTSISMALGREKNTEAWLYYLFLAIPVLALILSWRRWRSDRQAGPLGPVVPDISIAALASLAIMTAFLSSYFLRGSLEGRFGDIAPPVAVLAAAVLGASLSRGGGSRRRQILKAGAALAVLAVTVACIWSLQNIGAELYTGRMIESPAVIAEQTRRISQELKSAPTALREGQAQHRMEGADYLHRCTRPSDRVLILTYEPQLFVFSERLFAAGRATFITGFYPDERYSRDAMARLEAQSVPIALAGPESHYEKFPPVSAYVHAKYTEVGTVKVSEVSLRVLARNGVTSRPVGPRGLPCFR